MSLLRPIETVAIHDLALRPQEPVLSEAPEVIEAPAVSDQGSEVSEPAASAVSPTPEPPPAESPPPEPPDAAPDHAELSDQRDRDTDDLLALLRCSKRRNVLFLLAEARLREPQRATAEATAGAQGQAGRVSVGEIARYLDVDQKNLSHHLSPLRTAGLIFMTPRGQHHDYELTPARVAYERTDTGGFKLHVLGVRGSGVGVTIEIETPGTSYR
jgi:DNA-binding transcriptional ArsR family regulator